MITQNPEQIETRVTKRLEKDERIQAAIKKIGDAGGSGVIRLLYGNNGILLRVFVEAEVVIQESV